MDPMLVALLASGLLGAQKSSEQQKNYQQQQQIEAMKTRWAPFTGHPGQTLQRPSQLDPLMQSLLAGAMVGQSIGGNGAAAAGNAPAEVNPTVSTGAGNDNAANFRGPSQTNAMDLMDGTTGSAVAQAPAGASPMGAVRSPGAQSPTVPYAMGGGQNMINSPYLLALQARGTGSAP